MTLKSISKVICRKLDYMSHFKQGEVQPLLACPSVMSTSKKVKPSLSNKLEYSKGLYKQFIKPCSHRKIAAYGARHHERRSNGNLEGGVDGEMAMMMAVLDPVQHCLPHVQHRICHGHQHVPPSPLPAVSTAFATCSIAFATSSTTFATSSTTFATSSTTFATSRTSPRWQMTRTRWKRTRR